MYIKVGIAVVGLLVVIGLVSFSVFGGESEEIEFFTTDVTRGTIQNTVSATGTVEAVVTVQVGSQVSGQIQTLYADFNTIVSAGQLLAKLDPRTFESALENASASLVSARARVKTSQADLTNSRASLESARANLRASQVEAEKTQILFRRSEEMKAEDLISETDYDNARATAEAAVARAEQAEAAIKQAEAQIISREAGVEQSRAQVVQSEADVNRAEINLEYTNISSPVDGVVISREVDVGQTVAASMSAPTLFMIANDLALMRVNASIDEADIGKLSQSNQVGFTVDAYPGERFRGFIEEIRLNPQTSQNVVTYSVIIGVNNQDLKLKPGMTANITVTVDRKDNVLSIPNAALRYTPPDVDPQEVRALTRGEEGGGRRGGGALAHAAQAEGPAAPPEETAQRRRGGRVRGGESGEQTQAFRQLEGRAGQEGARGGRRGQGQRAGNDGGFGGGDSRAAAPGQMWDTGQKIQFQDAPPMAPRPGLVWVLDAQGVPEARIVTLGITDGARSELLVSDLQEGDQLIIGDSSQGEDGGRQQSFNPFAFGGRGFGGGRGRGRR
jgi:HlyD family secretion protein